MTAVGAFAQPEVLLPEDDAYPPGLLELPTPPPLWVLGHPPSGRLVAVVGTRRPDDRGRELAGRLASELVHRGYGVVSGLAPGIDHRAHLATLDAGGRTWAVLGSGVDLALEAPDRTLVRRIATDGGLLSEVEPGTPASNRALVARDRLQSALSLATIVVQTDRASGTMHTARFSLLQGRPLVVAAAPRGTASERPWSGNAALTDPRGCPPAVLHARGAAARQIEIRRPVADLVLSDPQSWEELWSLLASRPAAERGRPPGTGSCHH